MTRDEIVIALRCCDGGEYDECNKCPLRDGINCRNLLDLAAADLIENQKRHIEALMQANDSLKDAIARRDKQIEDMKQGMAQLRAFHFLADMAYDLDGVIGTLDGIEQLPALDLQLELLKRKRFYLKMANSIGDLWRVDNG